MLKNTVFIFFLVWLGWSCDTKEIKRDRFFLQGNVALDEREYSQAITHFSNALKVDPDFAMAYNNRGVAKMEDNRPFEAIQDYNQAILIDPSYWEAISNRSNAYEQTLQYEKSLADVMLLTDQFPDSLKYQFLKGIVLTHLDRLSEAEKVFSAIWEQDPTNIEALINQATVRYYQKDYKTAIQLLEEALSVDPSQANAYNTMNQIFLDIEQFPQALTSIEQALSIEPNHPIYLNNRGFTYLMLDSLRPAIENINASLVRDPENMWAFRNKGLYFLKIGDLTQAERYLSQAANSKHYPPSSYTYLAQVYEAQGDTEKANQTRLKEKTDHSH